MPFLLKEIGVSWKGAPLTNASAWMKDLVATGDSELVRRMKAAGFLLIGKTNAPEHGWCISTEPKFYGPDPQSLARRCDAGRLSGGAAAAVAARLVPIADASDGAGSIRVPASCCGDHRPRSRRAAASRRARPATISHGCAYILCVARSVRDVAAYLDAVAGGCPAIPIRCRGRDHLAHRGRAGRRRGLRIRIQRHGPPDGNPVDPEVEAAVRDTGKAAGAATARRSRSTT